jgi:hypothetical protein
MTMLRVLIIIGLCLLIFGPSLDVRAEVSVRTDRAGKYVSTQLSTTGARGEPVVWGLRGRASRRLHLLNPMGDLNGDLWPTISESNLAPHHPWVVWSRFNGTDFDLAWSRWAAGKWRPIHWLEGGPADGNDLDPDISFDAEGRPYLVWTRGADGSRQIYFSVFLLRRWMTGILISDSAIDSSFPVIVGHDGNVVEVEYTTPAGTVRQAVLFSRPVTITDDINPLTHVELKGTPTVVKG